MEMIKERMKAHSKWTLRKFHGDRHENYDKWARGEKGHDPFDVVEIEGNILLNEGITALQNLLTGAAETNYGNANAYVGVGDDATGESASHTGLQAAVNKLWKAMEATYPQIASQTTTWRGVFGSADANYAWNEFTVVNASDDTGDNLNRKVSAQGTKTAGQTWTLDLEITWS